MTATTPQHAAAVATDLAEAYARQARQHLRSSTTAREALLDALAGAGLSDAQLTSVRHAIKEITAFEFAAGMAHANVEFQRQAAEDALDPEPQS